MTRFNSIRLEEEDGNTFYSFISNFNFFREMSLCPLSVTLQAITCTLPQNVVVVSSSTLILVIIIIIIIIIVIVIIMSKHH
jgi:hypothetical protein